MRLAGSLDARGLRAGARGRLVVVALPGDAREAAVAWARAQGAASDVPTVLGLSMRHDELDVPLAAQDAIVIALSPSAPATLAALALAGIEGLAPAASVVSGRIGPVARALAVAGVWPARSVRSAAEERCVDMLTPVVVAVARSGPSPHAPPVAGGWPGPLRLIERVQRSGRGARGQRAAGPLVAESRPPGRARPHDRGGVH